ncbi:MAG: co-chaperone GroES [Cyanobium sp. MAG06]|nr:co-chaperone GroES [Cyanobium sp. MAG06]
MKVQTKTKSKDSKSNSHNKSNNIKMNKDINKSSNNSNENKTNIYPLADRVLIANIKKEETTASGLIISSNNEDKKYEGIVVAKGPGKIGDDNELIPIGLNIGDRVIYTKYGGDEIEYKGEKYIILKEEQILAILK